MHDVIVYCLVNAVKGNDYNVRDQMRITQNYNNMITAGLSRIFVLYMLHPCAVH